MKIPLAISMFLLHFGIAQDQSGKESYAPLVKAAADKADTEWAAAKAVKKIDPLVSAATAISSEQYKVHGFKEYLFGTSKAEIEKKFGQLGIGDESGWGLRPDGKAEILYFVEDKLVGVRRVYEGDNKGNLKAVLETFGKTTKKNTTAYTLSAVDTEPRTLYRPPAKTDRKVSRIDALFVFPKTVAYVFVTEFHYEVLDANAFSTNTRPVGRRSTQKVTVFVYDREFFVATLNRHVTTQRQTIEWFKAACEADDMAKLPKYPGHDTVAATVEEENGVLFGMRDTEKVPRLIFTAMRPKTGPPVYNLFHAPLPDLAEFAAGSARVLKPNRRVGLAKDEFETVPFPLASPNALLSELRSRLVQEYFPPADGTITFNGSRVGQFDPPLKTWVFKRL